MLSFIFAGKKKMPACTGHVGAIVDRCVDSDVTKRFGSVAEIVDALESLPEGVKSAV